MVGAAGVERVDASLGRGTEGNPGGVIAWSEKCRFGATQLCGNLENPLFSMPLLNGARDAGYRANICFKGD